MTDFVALGCLVLALLILQFGVRQQDSRFRLFLRAMWVLTALLSVSALVLYSGQ